MTSEEIEEIGDEVYILGALDHPNVCKYYETYEDHRYLYLVMEYCEGGELFEYLANKKNGFKEARAAEIIEKLLLAINHCHENEISHRDIKP